LREFQKNPFTPLHSTPVQAEDQALLQASSDQLSGILIRLPVRMSPVVLKLVINITKTGIR